MESSRLDIEESWRYSDKPKRKYIRFSKGVEIGTATSALLDSVQAWNLAFLSFEIEERTLHIDPYFTTHVRHSLQTELASGHVDITLTCPFKGAVGSLLVLPAPRFVSLIRTHPILDSLPLFKAYGQRWLDTIDERSHLCGYDRDLNEKCIADFTQANEIIDRFRLYGLK